MEILTKILARLRDLSKNAALQEVVDQLVEVAKYDDVHYFDLAKDPYHKLKEELLRCGSHRQAVTNNIGRLPSYTQLKTVRSGELDRVLTKFRNVKHGTFV